jgi:hypothetical protein
MTKNANCECGEKQTSSHLLESKLLPCRCEMKDLIGLTKITDEMIGIIEYWENKGF